MLTKTVTQHHRSHSHTHHAARKLFRTLPSTQVPFRKPLKYSVKPSNTKEICHYKINDKISTQRGVYYTVLFSEAQKTLHRKSPTQVQYKKTDAKKQKVLESYTVKDYRYTERGVYYSVLFSEAKLAIEWKSPKQAQSENTDCSLSHLIDSEKLEVFLCTQTLWERPWRPIWCNKPRPDLSPLLFCMKATNLVTHTDSPLTENATQTQTKVENTQIYNKPQLCHTEYSDDEDTSDDDGSDDEDIVPSQLFNTELTTEDKAYIEEQTKIAYMCMATRLPPDILRARGYLDNLEDISFRFPPEANTPVIVYPANISLKYDLVHSRVRKLQRL